MVAPGKRSARSCRRVVDSPLRGASLVVSLFVAGCSRTPPEPAPATTASTSESQVHASATSATSAGATAKDARCITPVPSAPPTLPASVDGASCPPDPEPNARLSVAEVTFPEAPSPLRVDVELAKRPHEVERGLMYRRSMPEMHGMLFKLDGRRDHTFWMHNTCLALDMLFVDDDGMIVGIVEGAAPLTDSIRSVGCPSSYVLEVNAGWTRKHGVKPGQKLTLPPSIR